MIGNYHQAPFLAALSSSRSLVVGWSVRPSVHLCENVTFLPTYETIVTVVTLVTVVTVVTVMTVATVATVVTVVTVGTKQLLHQKS